MPIKPRRMTIWKIQAGMRSWSRHFARWKKTWSTLMAMVAGVREGLTAVGLIARCYRCPAVVIIHGVGSRRILRPRGRLAQGGQ